MGKEELVNKEKTLSNAKKELKGMEEQLVNTEKFLELGKREYELKCANHGIAIGEYEIVRPVWKFETNKEYLDNMKEISEINFERFKLDTEGKISSQESNVETLKTQIEERKSTIAKLEKEVEGLKK